MDMELADARNIARLVMQQDGEDDNPESAGSVTTSGCDHSRSPRHAWANSAFSVPLLGFCAQMVLSSPSLSIPLASADLNQSVGNTAADHPPVEVGTKRTRD